MNIAFDLLNDLHVDVNNSQMNIILPFQTVTIVTSTTINVLIPVKFLESLSGISS